LKSKDALHVACAIEAGADDFITTDDRIIRKLEGFSQVTVVDPIAFIDYVEELPT
jgi:predicted nucleic acid-binding protein